MRTAPPRLPRLPVPRGRAGRTALPRALALSTIVATALVACSGAAPVVEEVPERAAVPSDPPPVPVAHETAHADLPGIEGFESLDAPLRARVLARANRATCDCGCVGHTVAECVAEVEGCAVAERLATAFVDDALAVQLQAPRGAEGEGAVRGAADPERSAPGGAEPPPTNETPQAGTSAGDGPASAEGEPS